MTGWRSKKPYSFTNMRWCSRCYTTESTQWIRAKGKVGDPGVLTVDSVWCKKCYAYWYRSQHPGEGYQKKLKQRVMLQNRQLRHQIKMAERELEMLKSGFLDEPLVKHPHKRHMPTSVDILRGVAERQEQSRPGVG